MRNLSWVLALALALGASVAHAQPTPADRDVARRLVIEGRARSEAGQHSAALEMFQRAHDIMHVPTTGWDLAQAHEALNQLVEARAACVEVSNMPVQSGEPPIFAEVRKNAKEAVTNLDSRIPRIELHIVGPSLESARIEIDGKVVPSKEMAKPYPVNPGKHRVVVTAPDYETYVDEVVEVQETQTIPLEFKLVPGTKPTVKPPDVIPTVLVKPELPAPVTRRMIVGIAGGGLALVSLGTAIGAAATYRTMVTAKSDYGFANQSYCDEVCLLHKKTYDERRPVLQTLTIAATVSGGLGVAALVFALLDKPVEMNDVSLVVVPMPGGLIVQGAF